MKILYVNKFLYSRGGAETYFLKIGEHYQANGHEVQYFGMYDEKNSVGNSLGLTTTNMDFHTSSLKRVFYPFRIIYSGEAKRKLKKVIEDFKPDIIHLNNINFQLTPSIIYAAKKCGVPVVWTLHDYQLICPNHLLYNCGNCEKCVNGSKFNCAKGKCIHGSKAKSIIGSIEAVYYRSRHTYKKVDRFICPSSFLEKMVLSNADLQGKTVMIRNFSERLQPTSKREGKYVLFFGRLSEEKGINVLADAARKLPEVSFLVAGDGPEAKTLENIVNVENIGFLSGEKLANTVAGAYCVVVPSVWYENCPLSILEAMGLGVPVITVNQGGMAELVQDGVTGMKISAADSALLAEAVGKIWNDESLRETLSKNCLDSGEKLISLPEYCDKLMTLYNDVIAEKN